MDLDEHLPHSMAEAFWIEQVFMNMLVNARDALSEGGSVKISSKKWVLERGNPDLPEALEPGEYVRISISDTGHGMSQETIERIFEPFFTTKEQGKGTGLGLASSFAIIRQHNGWIVCVSELGSGTVFHTYLPVCAANTPPAPTSVDVEPTTPASANILVVDDEQIVRVMLEALLKRSGYQVQSAVDGQDALDKVDAGQQFDLLIMDLTMPRLDGKETFHALRNVRNNQTPVIICSGYLPDPEVFQRDTGHTPQGFLPKPYKLEELTVAVERVLKQSRLSGKHS
jgi:CheY-like chemotaxis protein